jgi:hypothetical protein
VLQGGQHTAAHRLETSRLPGCTQVTICSPFLLPCSLAAGPREAIATLDHPGRPVLGCSASGRAISAVWPVLRAYAVYCLAPTGAWEVADRGAAAVGTRAARSDAQWLQSFVLCCLLAVGVERHTLTVDHVGARSHQNVAQRIVCLALLAGSGNNVVWSSTQPMYAVISGMTNLAFCPIARSLPPPVVFTPWTPICGHGTAMRSKLPVNMPVAA